MIPKSEQTMSPHQQRVVRRYERDDTAVSEVLGVIMMLAMVVSIMGGVWVFLNPYISDFEDNTNWNAANGIADRMEDRIDVAADSPEGTGIRHSIAMRTSLIQGVSNLEVWSISADLTSSDIIKITDHTSTSFTVQSVNETATSVTIYNENGVSQFGIDVNTGVVDHNMQLTDWYIITVLNDNDEALHKTVKYTISGLRIITSLGNGEHEIYLVNNARIEHFADSAWEISQFPRVEFDDLATGGVRLSIILTNIKVNGSLGSSNQLGMDIISAGSLTPFAGQCFNIRFALTNSVAQVITPQYDEQWLTEYTLNRASGTLDSFIGLAPFERASGADGVTVNSLGHPIYFDVTVNEVVVER
tara:strand:+ start:1135 stop:2211 length:1077 start_codon:yes stop_codon:yes gene_type:complete